MTVNSSLKLQRASANDKAGGTKKKTIGVNVYEGAMTQRLITEVRIMPADLTLYEGEEMGEMIARSVPRARRTWLP